MQVRQPSGRAVPGGSVAGGCSALHDTGQPGSGADARARPRMALACLVVTGAAWHSDVNAVQQKPRTTYFPALVKTLCFTLDE